MTYALTARTRQHARKFPDPPYCVDTNSQQAQGLVLWLPMDPRGGGTAFDRSGYGHLGAFVNGPAWGYDDYGNGALEFNGAGTGEVNLTGLSVTGGSLSVTCRARVTVADGGNRWLLDAGSGRLIVSPSNDGAGAQLSYFDGTWRGCGATPVGVWFHWATALDGAAAAGAVYRDGAVSGTAAYAAKNLAGSVRLGNHNNGGGANPFGGLVADFRVYNYALPAALVWDVYDRPAALAYPLRRRVWSFPTGNRRRRVLLTGGR